MKKVFSLLLAAALVLCAMTVTVFAAPGNASYGDVPLYKGGITIDGKMDEAYKLGLKIDASLDYSDALATDTTADLYLLHDGEYLYILYDVKSAFDIDPGKYNPANANANDSWKGSGTELYLVWNNITGATGNDVAKLEGWIDGQMWGAAGTAAAGNEYQYVDAYKTTYDVAAKTYMMEWKLPMQETELGSEVGFYAMITSNKDMFNGAQDTICTTAPGQANRYGQFLNITISEKEVALPEPEPVVVPPVEEPASAPQTFDMGVIAVVSAVISAAGAAISKKKH